MNFNDISELITSRIAIVDAGVKQFTDGCDQIDGRLREFVAGLDLSTLQTKEFILSMKHVESELECVKAAIPEIVGGLDELKPYYTADPKPDVAHIYEEATGWRRFIPGLTLKKTTVVEHVVIPRDRSVSLQTAFLNAKTWNDQLMQAIVAIADFLGNADERLEDRLVDIKEVAVNADKAFASASEDSEARSLLARRLYMEEIAKAVREHLVSISLYRREFSTLAAGVRKSMEELPEEEFFNVKSEEDVERYIEEAKRSNAL